MIEKICARLEALTHDNPMVTSNYILRKDAIQIVHEVAKECGDGWIPVETELPEDATYIYATCISLVDNREPWVIEGVYFNGFERMTNMLEHGDAKVIAWMPKKQPPTPYHIRREITKMEIKENTHIVIKREDALKYLTEPEYQTLEELSHKIIRGRAKDNKTPCNSYYIVNHDEPYAEMVKGVILGGEYAKSAPFQKGE